MELKDYYAILDLPPSSTMDEVKKAYRKLAHQFHPDKNENDLYAAARFAEVKEAYETLTNPVKKEHYLQQRWYARSTGKRMNQGIINPVNILKQLIELDQYTHSLDEHRMDREGLYQYICSILSMDHIEKLNLFKEESINQEIIYSAIRSGRFLSYPLAQSLAERVKKINTDNESVSVHIREYVSNKKQADYWEKRKVIIVAIVVILLSVAIFLSAT